MYVERLKLTFFRNYEHLLADFGPGINCITGPNGSGKTNILEAIHFLSMTRGFQSQSERYALKEGEQFFFCEGLFREFGMQEQEEEQEQEKEKGKGSEGKGSEGKASGLEDERVGEAGRIAADGGETEEDDQGEEGDRVDEGMEANDGLAPEGEGEVEIEVEGEGEGKAEAGKVAVAGKSGLGTDGMTNAVGDRMGGKKDAGSLGMRKSLLVQCNYLPGKGKKILIGGKALKKMSAHIGRLPVISVLPHDTQLIHGGPALRRKFLDSFISQYDAAYLQQLIAYDKALTQRNALLSSFAERGIFAPDELALWDRLLIPAGRMIHAGRVAFLEGFRPLFLKYFKAIVSDKETPSMELDSAFSENTAEEWAEIFRAAQDKDRFSQRSSTGVHKEDLKFRINGQPVRHFGSQGQQKTFVIALRLAQYELLTRQSGKEPLLLLDDIFDKLDEHRLQAIAGILDQSVAGQVFVTDTSAERISKAFRALNEKPVQLYQLHQKVLKKQPQDVRL